MKEIDHIERLGVYGTIILQQIFKKISEVYDGSNSP
jgi:hypothetical protein